MIPHSVPALIGINTFSTRQLFPSDTTKSLTDWISNSFQSLRTLLPGQNDRSYWANSLRIWDRIQFAYPRMSTWVASSLASLTLELLTLLHCIIYTYDNRFEQSRSLQITNMIIKKGRIPHSLNDELLKERVRQEMHHSSWPSITSGKI